MNSLPETGYLRLSQIIGRKASKRGEDDSSHDVAPLFPVSRTTWWKLVTTGQAPKPVKLGGSTLWRCEDIRALIAKIDEIARTGEAK